MSKAQGSDSAQVWPTPAAYDEALGVKPRATGPQKLFDITCTIGSIYAGGDMPARAAAFLLIAEHGAVGTYSFEEPGDGGITTVTVGFTPHN